MVAPDRPPTNGLNRQARQIYNPLGFTRFYNFVLWFIFSGALFGFLLARASYMNFNGVFCNRKDSYHGAAPGECFSYSQGHYKVGIIMHLMTIIPAGLLALLQFLPVLRHKWILFHRINGYVVIVLLLTTIAGALMIARKSFGGTLSTQLFIGVLAMISVTSHLLAYINIKRFQIDQHRKWMLRGWICIGSIITERITLLAVEPIITQIGSYYYAMPCSKITAILTSFGAPEKAVASLYPPCISFLNGTAPNQYAVVHANQNGNPEEVAASLDMAFGMTLWLALLLHAVGIEIYLRLTPRESERLRQVSFERQQKAGLSHPGSAGLTADRLGDALPWLPVKEERALSDTKE